MTTRAVTTCDFCGKETEQADHRWGKLVIGRVTDGAVTIHGPGSSRDICPRCIAKVDGWKGDTRGAA